MNTRVKATDYELTQETRDYLDTRLLTLEKLLSKEASAVARFEIELGRAAGRPRHGKNLWFAEIQIIVPGEAPIRATNNAESINAAIDDVKEEVERQLRKNKQRGIRLTRRIGARVKKLLWRE